MHVANQLIYKVKLGFHPNFMYAQWGALTNHASCLGAELRIISVALPKKYSIICISTPYTDLSTQLHADWKIKSSFSLYIMRHLYINGLCSIAKQL